MMRPVLLILGLLLSEASLSCSCFDVDFEADVVNRFVRANLVAAVEVIDETTSSDTYKNQTAILKILNTYKGTVYAQETIEVSGITIGTMCGRSLVIGQIFIYDRPILAVSILHQDLVGSVVNLKTMTLRNWNW